MKKHPHILTLLLTLLNSVVVFAHPNDSISIKPVLKKDTTAIHQKAVKRVPSKTVQVQKNLANLEAEVRKLSGQNYNKGTSGTLAPTTVVWAKKYAQTIWHRKQSIETIK